MFINSQRLNYKISPLDQRYSRRLKQNLQASEKSFGDIETPGWTSMMRSEISERNKNNQKNNALNQADIYNKLSNNANKLQWSANDEKKMIKSKHDSKNDPKQMHIQSLSANKSNQTAQPQLKTKSKQKRWNQISVHQNLFRNSIKLQNKKIINKILDEEIKKKQIFKFTPTINKKSIILAQSKFSRAKQSQQAVQKIQNTIQTQATQRKQKQDKDVQRYRILNKLFYYLSQNMTLLTQKSLQNTVSSLPMPCLNVIQNIVKKIYQGQQMQWLDFLQNFNDKNVKGKQGFFALLTKWFARNQAGFNAKHNISCT